MPDITMCFGDNCPNKLLCYRYMAKVEDDGTFQTYFVKPPMKEDKSCDYYWPRASK